MEDRQPRGVRSWSRYSRSFLTTNRFKADIAAQAKKKAAARQKEAERKQVETLNRKHLAGLRVLQKNLVYIMGMNTSGGEEDMELLRGPQHFGRYGKIVKIAASKAKEGYGGHHSAAIYVTFANKDDARDCITALDGTMHGGRMLKYILATVLERCVDLCAGLNTVPQSTARPSCATKRATIAIAPFSTRLGTRTTASVGKTFPPSTPCLPSGPRQLDQALPQSQRKRRHAHQLHPLDFHRRLQRSISSRKQ